MPDSSLSALWGSTHVILTIALCGGSCAAEYNHWMCPAPLQGTLNIHVM